MKNLVQHFVVFLIGIASSITVVGNDSVLVKPIKSNSQQIQLIVNNQQQYNWTIEPEINPDVFVLSNNLLSQQLTFVSDVDSTSFETLPGKVYKFCIIYKNKPCYVAITATKNPFLLQPFCWPIALVLFLSALFLTPFFKINTLFNFLKLGIAVPISFWILTIIAGFVHGNYNHIQNAVSNLGEIYSSSEILMAIGTFIIGLIQLVYVIAFIKTSYVLKINILPAFLSLSMPISFLWAAVFPSGNIYHGLLGPLPVLIIIAAVLSIFVWNKIQNHKYIKIRSAIAAGIMLLFVVRFIPAIQQYAEGLIQRFLYIGWTIFSISTSIWLQQLLLQQCNTHSKKV
jgi:hypothetical membrane protein